MFFFFWSKYHCPFFIASFLKCGKQSDFYALLSINSLTKFSVLIPFWPCSGSVIFEKTVIFNLQNKRFSLVFLYIAFSWKYYLLHFHLTIFVINRFCTHKLYKHVKEGHIDLLLFLPLPHSWLILHVFWNGC